MTACPLTLKFGEEKRAGATVDDFDLLKVIGKGSFGKVRTMGITLFVTHVLMPVRWRCERVEA